MIFLKRRRLIFWLFKAYLRKWRKTILLSFVLGLIVFFLLRYVTVYFANKIPFIHQETVGIVGAYTANNLPSEILYKISSGLTTVAEDGRVKPGVAKSWEVKDNGKTYVFHLKDDVYFSDGEKLDSSKINYNFMDVVEEKPDKQTIIYKLKDNYSPFLMTVARPIYKDNLIGVGSYKVKKVHTNGSFIASIDLVSVENDFDTITYQMYPTEEALKMAFVIGDVTVAQGLHDLKIKDTDLSNFKNAVITRNIESTELVTLFYDTTDPLLSDKKLRQALAYTMPDQFEQGERNHGPFSVSSWANQEGIYGYQYDLAHAEDLISQSESATSSGQVTVEIKALKKYEQLAKTIRGSWKKIGVETKITIVESLPISFQAYLGDYRIPADPDQYSLWHSDQENNISNYKNLRIDKLLEDGRKTDDTQKRIKIYSDFQKYLLDDVPASFLYSPYKYTVKRN